MTNFLLAQSGWAMLILRVVVGVTFIMHGWSKLKGFKSTAQWLGGAGFKPGVFWAAVLTAAEFGGGILILIGLWVPYLALILTISMLVATGYKLKSKVPFTTFTATGWELDVLLIAALLTLATVGSGFFALGNVL